MASLTTPLTLYPPPRSPLGLPFVPLGPPRSTGWVKRPATAPPGKLPLPLREAFCLFAPPAPRGLTRGWGVALGREMPAGVRSVFHAQRTLSALQGPSLAMPCAPLAQKSQTLPIPSSAWSSRTPLPPNWPLPTGVPPKTLAKPLLRTLPVPLPQPRVEGACFKVVSSKRTLPRAKSRLQSSPANSPLQSWQRALTAGRPCRK